MFEQVDISREFNRQEIVENYAGKLAIVSDRHEEPYFISGILRGNDSLTYRLERGENSKLLHYHDLQFLLVKTLY